MDAIEPELSPTEVRRILSLIPVREIGDVEWRDYAERLATVCQAFGIDARVDGDVGIAFPGNHFDDDALLTTLETLLQRRLGRSHR